MANSGGSAGDDVRGSDERGGGEGGRDSDQSDVQREVDLLGPRGRAVLACRLTSRARDQLNAKLDELWNTAVEVDRMIEENEELVRVGADDAVRRKARALLHVTRAQVTCLKVEAAYMLASLQMWCDLAESLVVVHAQHEDYSAPGYEELWDTIGKVIEERDRMRLAAT